MRNFHAEHSIRLASVTFLDRQFHYVLYSKVVVRNDPKLVLVLFLDRDDKAISAFDVDAETVFHVSVIDDDAE